LIVLSRQKIILADYFFAIYLIFLPAAAAATAEATASPAAAKTAAAGSGSGR
jgi:hypothetical protein